MATLALALSLALLIGFAGVTSQWWRAERLRQESDRFAADLIVDRGLAQCAQGDTAEGMLWLAQGLQMADRVKDSGLSRTVRMNVAAWNSPAASLRVILPHDRHLSDWKTRLPDGTLSANQVLSVAFSPDGRTILTGSDDHQARLWDAATGRLIDSPLRTGGKVQVVTFSPDGKTILTASHLGTGTADRLRFSQRGEIRLWNAITRTPLGKPLPVEGDLRNNVPLCAAFNPDGRSIITGGIDQKVRIWDAGLTREVGELPGQNDESSRDSGSRAVVLAYSSDGRIVLVGRGKSLSVLLDIRCFDATTGRPVGKPVTAIQDRSGPLGFNAVALSPDGRTIATSEGGKILLRDRDSGSPIGQPIVQPGRVVCLAFRPDGKAIVSGSAFLSEYAQVRLWATDTGQSLGPPLRHPGDLTAVAFRLDGRAIVTGCERPDTDGKSGEARVWDLVSEPPTGMVLEDPDQDRFVALCRDGGAILVKDGGAGVSSSRELTTYERLGPPLSPADGGQLLALSLRRRGCPAGRSGRGRPGVGTGHRPAAWLPPPEVAATSGVQPSAPTDGRSSPAASIARWDQARPDSGMRRRLGRSESRSSLGGPSSR